VDTVPIQPYSGPIIRRTALPAPAPKAEPSLIGMLKKNVGKVCLGSVESRQFESWRTASDTYFLIGHVHHFFRRYFQRAYFSASEARRGGRVFRFAEAVSHGIHTVKNLA
jgi:hypothetical protein